MRSWLGKADLVVCPQAFPSLSPIPELIDARCFNTSADLLAGILCPRKMQIPGGMFLQIFSATYALVEIKF